MNDLTFDSYQTKCNSFVAYPDVSRGVYPIFGLVGEVAELVEKYLKRLDLPPHFQLVQYLSEAVRVGKECERVAKQLRDSGGFVQKGENEAVAYAVETADFDQEFEKEIGDCQFMIAQLCTDIHTRLIDVACLNVKKLTDRQNRKVIQGEGDNR